MGICIDLGYEVVSQVVNIAANNGGNPPQEVRVTAPAGKKPLSGSVNFVDHTSGFGITHARLVGSYPDGSDWVFLILGNNYYVGGWDVEVHVVCIST